MVLSAKGVVVPDEERSECPILLAAAEHKRKRDVKETEERDLKKIKRKSEIAPWTAESVGISEDMFAHFPPTFTRERWDEIMGLILGRSAVDIRQDALEKRIDEAKSKHAGDEAAAAKANIRILCSMAAPTNASLRSMAGPPREPDDGLAQ